MSETTILQLVTQDIGRFAQALHSSSSSYLQYIALFLLGSLSLGYFVDSYGSADPREPKKLRPSVPLVGHLMGMLAKHTRFYDDL